MSDWTGRGEDSAEYKPEIENLKPDRNKQLRVDESIKNQTKNSVLTSAEIWTPQR